MDLASCWAAEILPLPDSGGEILDLCAAPGREISYLAERMHSEASLTLNELSPQRRHRLKNVLRDYVPEDTLQRIRVTGYDGSRWGCTTQTGTMRYCSTPPAHPSAMYWVSKANLNNLP